MKTLRYIVCAIMVCAMCASASAVTPLSRTTLPTAKLKSTQLHNDPTVQVKIDSITQAQIDSIVKAKVDSIVKTKVDSIAKAMADSIIRAQADSTAKAKADSIAKAKADSIAKAKADSIAKAKADSIAREQTKPKWNSCTIRGLKLKGTIGSQSLTVTCNTQVLWDSIVVLSVFPVSLLPIEIYHVEATPTEIIMIDRLKKTYTCVSYNELNQYVRPKLTYKDLQAMASAEKPASAKNGVISYSVGDDTAILDFTYPNPVFNQTISVSRADLKGYKKVDIKKFL